MTIKNIVPFLALGLPLICGMPQARAEAVSFTSTFTDEGPSNNGVNFTGNYSIGFNPSGTYHFGNLSAGSPVTITDFLAITDTLFFAGTDQLAVSFNFTVPVGGGSGTIDGTGSATLVFGFTDGTISFPSTPTAITLGDGSVIDISLSSDGFTDFFSDNTAEINATLDWLGPSVAATPLPATLPLFAGGLGLVGMIARRKKQKSKATLAAV